MTMLALVVLHFSIGILFTTDAGNYWLDIFNDYSANINLLVCGLMQYIVTGFKISSIYLLDIWTNQKCGFSRSLMNSVHRSLEIGI